jgi:Cu(I)/Ag(I) efflux system membrane protein CusA/SilA
MTFATTFIGLVPILWATGTGADVMKRIAAPMVGGLFTSFVLELVVYPVIYRAWKWNAEVKALASEAHRDGTASAPAQGLDDLHRLPGGEATA